jgi:hypothetical protein
MVCHPIISIGHFPERFRSGFIAHVAGNLPNFRGALSVFSYSLGDWNIHDNG